MTEPAISVLVMDADPAVVDCLRAAGMSVASGSSAPGAHDAVLLAAAGTAALEALAARADLAQRAFESALVVWVGDDDGGGAAADSAAAEALLLQGVEAVLPANDLATLPRQIRHAVLRKRIEKAARTAYATDLATGLPHQAQLLEHMTQLLALREREPAAMVLLVLRVEGYASAAARLGSEAANVLRRKVAVRLRSGLRASDVVAAIGPDDFGVLLGHLEAPGDGERVAAKLVRSLELPLKVAGQACPVRASVGLALYPTHGKDARTLLQRASAQASSVATVGAAGFGARVERAPQAAANDDNP
jgi:diguanylate cyclase (GGDEF)-like protein